MSRGRQRGTSSQVILTFQSPEDKSKFIGGLLDGWGEGGPFTVDWESGKSDKEGMDEIPATAAPELFVTVTEEE